jgi:hypothetical protein
MGAVDAAEILNRYDEQVRRNALPPPGWTSERIGPGGRILRETGTTRGSRAAFIGYADLDEGTADQAIAEQVAYFADLGGRSEWKLYGHDRPADLGARLEAAGLLPEDTEALVVGTTDEVIAALDGAASPPGVTIRTADGDDDYARIATMHGEVWGKDYSWFGPELAAEKAAAPELMDVYIAEADGVVVSSGWIRYVPGTDFAGLWGGSTLAEWRRKGIYRSLVDIRARRAHERGYRFLQVDASPNSEPILARLGLIKLTWTRPYVWPVAD